MLREAYRPVRFGTAGEGDYLLDSQSQLEAMESVGDTQFRL